MQGADAVKARAFLSLFRMEVGNCMQFRASFWMKLLLYLFWTLVRVSIFVAFFRFGGNAQDGLTMEQAVGMAWLIQICTFLVGMQGVDLMLYGRVTSGDIALDLLRPLALYPYMYGHLMANKLSRFLPYALPLLVAGYLIPGGYGLPPPASPLHALAFPLALASGFLLSCACEMLSYAASLDVRFGRNMSTLLAIGVQVLSGAFIPLQLFPNSWQAFLRWQLFAGMIDLPVRLYAGSIPLGELPLILASQLGWFLVIMAIGVRWVNHSGRRIVLQGG